MNLRLCVLSLHAYISKSTILLLETYITSKEDCYWHFGVILLHVMPHNPYVLGRWMLPFLAAWCTVHVCHTPCHLRISFPVSGSHASGSPCSHLYSPHIGTIPRIEPIQYISVFYNNLFGKGSTIHFNAWDECMVHVVKLIKKCCINLNKMTIWFLDLFNELTSENLVWKQQKHNNVSTLCYGCHAAMTYLRLCWCRKNALHIHHYPRFYTHQHLCTPIMNDYFYVQSLHS